MKQYSALAYIDDAQKSILDGKLTVNENQLIFTSNDNQAFHSSISNLSCNKLGATLICFQDQHTGLKYTTSDEHILSESSLNHFKKESIRSVSKSKTKRATAIILAIVGLLIAGACISFYFFRKEIVNSIVDSIPEKVEDDLGRGYIYDLGKSVGLDSTSTIHKELMEKAKPIFSQHTKPFKIYISPDTTINAFALPGGYLVFNKGLLTKAKKWEEVLGVAAHEMAHVTLKHHSRGLVSQLGWVSLLSLFLGDAGAMTQLIMGTAGQLAQLNYSRDFESEADEKGFEYLTKANIDPQGMVDFFKILEEQYGSKQSVPQFMSTHPDTKNRIAAIQAKVNAYTSKSHVKFSEYESFKFKADSLVIKTL